jgi:hypothetical protein
MRVILFGTGILLLAAGATGRTSRAALPPAEGRQVPVGTMQAGWLRGELAKSVFPGEALAVQVCRGPMRFGPGDVPVRDVVVTR